MNGVTENQSRGAAARQVRGVHRGGAHRECNTRGTARSDHSHRFGEVDGEVQVLPRHIPSISRHSDGGHGGGHIVHHRDGHGFGISAGCVCGLHAHGVSARRHAARIGGPQRCATDVEQGVVGVARTRHQGVGVRIARVCVCGGQRADGGIGATRLADGCCRQADVGGGIVHAGDVYRQGGSAGGGAGIAVGGRDGECFAGVGQATIDGRGVGHIHIRAITALDVQRAVSAQLGHIVSNCTNNVAPPRCATLNTVAGNAVCVCGAERASLIAEGVGGGRICQRNSCGCSDHGSLIAGDRDGERLFKRVTRCIGRAHPNEITARTQCTGVGCNK